MSSLSSDEDDQSLVKGKVFEQYQREAKEALPLEEKNNVEKPEESASKNKVKKNKKDSKESSVKKTNKKTKKEEGEKKGAKDWTDDEVSILIDMLEERPCLWDCFDKEYSKRDLKDIAYTEIASVLDVTITSLKTKINGLRAQFGRELAKVNKTKSGPSTDELYVPSWIYYQRLLFLMPVVKSTKSRDTHKRKNDEEIYEIEDEEDIKPPSNKKKTIAERKLDILSKCAEAITKPETKPANTTVVTKQSTSTFAAYIDERLSKLSDRGRRIAEKRIDF